MGNPGATVSLHAYFRGVLMCRQLGSVPPHSPHGPWHGTRSDMTGMDIAGIVATAGRH